MTSTIAGKQTLGMHSPRSRSNSRPQQRGGAAASDNGVGLTGSRIEKFDESKYEKKKKNRRINSANRNT